MNTQAGDADVKPKAILSHGDNFYWTGINSEDGRDSRFTSTFEGKFDGDNLAGIPFVNVLAPTTTAGCSRTTSTSTRSRTPTPASALTSSMDSGDADVHAAQQVCCQCYGYSEGDDDSCNSVARGDDFSLEEMRHVRLCFAKFTEWSDDSRKQLAEKVQTSNATWKIVNSHYSPSVHYAETGMKEWFDILEGSGIHAWVYGHTHG
ncbi:Metallo-dependent phosphatase-like [Phytophthora cactorum]|nr:Metallo-dependent phosphatase-like [Phytophthora cactorum]